MNDTPFPPALVVPAQPPLAESDLPPVAVIIPNLNGSRHLTACLSSLDAMRYSKDRLEVVLVDNGSDDGSVGEVRARWPSVRIVENDRNEGFARACNQGVRAAREARVVAFLNNDMRVHEDWLRALVAPIARGACAATTSKMLSWDGSRIDSAGGGMNFHGMGLQYGYRDVPAPRHDVPRRTLFPCGGAMAIDAATFEAAGGFDEEFFAYYEDVDLGWRLWVMGHEAHYAPASVCWHHHHGTSSRLPVQAVRRIQVRNPLLACFKNYDDAHLRQVLPVALALLLRRAGASSGLDQEPGFRIEIARPADQRQQPTLIDRARARLSGRPGTQYGESPIGNLAAADLLAANDLLGRWPHWVARRADVQARRRRADADIFGLFLRPLWCIEDEPGYRALFEGATEFFGLARLFDGLSVMPEDPQT